MSAAENAPAPAAVDPCPATLRQLDDYEASIESAWEGMDRAGLTTSADLLERGLVCVNEPLTPNDAAAYFRAHALVAWVQTGGNDSASTSAAYVAARAIQPAYSLPQSLAGENHPLRVLYDDAAGKAVAAPKPLPPPAEGSILVDGRRALDAPTDRMWLYQRLAADGSVAETGVIAVGQTPTYEVARSVDPVTGEVVHHTSRWLAVGGGVAALAAAGGMTGAFLVKQAYIDGAPLEDPNNGQVTTNKALGWGGIGAAVVAGGLGATAVFVGRW